MARSAGTVRQLVCGNGRERRGQKKAIVALAWSDGAEFCDVDPQSELMDYGTCILWLPNPPQGNGRAHERQHDVITCWRRRRRAHMFGEAEVRTPA